MATKLDDINQYFKPGLILTVLGKEYTVPLPDAELGLWCQQIASLAGDINAASTEQEMQNVIERIDRLPKLPGGKDVTLEQRVLGRAYDQMRNDNVPHPYIQFCGQTAFFWIIGGEEAAAKYWQSGGRPEAMRPTRAERRAQARIGVSRTGVAAKTQSPGSTNGMRSRMRSSKNGKAGK